MCVKSLMFCLLCTVSIQVWSQGYIGVHVGVTSVSSKHRKGEISLPYRGAIRDLSHKISEDSQAIDSLEEKLAEEGWDILNSDVSSESLDLSLGGEVPAEISCVYIGNGNNVTLSNNLDIPEALFAANTEVIGLGDSDVPDSLIKAQNKLLNFFDIHAAVVKSYIGDFGFTVPDYQQGDIRVVGDPGKARSLYVREKTITHSFLPSFKAHLVENFSVDDKDLITIPIDSFVDLDDFRNAINNRFFNDLHGRMMAAWNDVAVDLAQQEAALADAARLAGTETETHSTHFTFGLVAGLDKSRFCSKASQYGLYLGAEAFYDGNFGEIDIPTCGEGLVPQTKLTLKARNAFGASGLVGVTTRGGWTLYAPISAKANYYRFGLEKPTSVSPTELDGLVSLLDQQNENTSQPSFGSWNDHENHWKFEGEAGVGVRLNVSQRLTMGFRWTHSFGSKLSFNTPAYEAQSVREIDSKGATHEIDSSQQRLVFECLLRL